MRCRRWTAGLIGALIVACGAGSPARAESGARLAPSARYAAPGGNDREDCRSSARPCGTLARAAALADPGATVYLAPGLYPERLSLAGVLTVEARSGAILDGGGLGTVLRIGPAARVTLRGLTVQHGLAMGGVIELYGGGIYNEGSLILERVVVQDNRTRPLFDAEGGGIYNLGVLSIRASTVRRNSASNAGGGLFNGRPSFGTVRAEVLGSAIVDNQATITGGGIYNDGDLLVGNSTIAGNASLGGGGINNQAWARLVNSTISANRATGPQGGGGGLWNAGTMRLENSIVAGNVAANAPDCALPGSGLQGSHNLVGAGAQDGMLRHGSCIFAGGARARITRTARPLVGPLAANGGPTPTMRPLPGSPAIGAGDPRICSRAPVGGVDQRGHARARATCDLGAYDTAGEAR